MTVDLPSLYDHQSEIFPRLRAALARQRKVILCANPGFGKTRLAKWLMGASLAKPKNDTQSGEMLFAVHRRGLVDNASQSFGEDPPLPHGVIMSGMTPAWGERVQVASIDTLLAWHVDSGRYTIDRTFDLVCLDEIHSHLSKFRKWLEAHDSRRAELGLHPAFVVGLSATPRATGLADVFGEIVLGPSTEWLIEHGYLSPYEYFRATTGRLGLLVRRGGEFTKDSVCKAMDGLAGDLVRDWKRLAEGLPTVGFFPRLSHAREAQELLCGAGVRAEYVDGSTDDDERRAIFRRLDCGQIDYLCNVGVVERGTNIPAIACVQLCLAVGSVVRYRQLIGRGSRVSEGKTRTIVLDHGGNVERHGFFEDDPEWILDRSQREVAASPARPTIHCPKCDRVYRGGKCLVCGYEPTRRQRLEQGLDFDGTELVRWERPSKTKPKKKPKSCEQLMIEALFRAGGSGRTWKQALGIAYRAAEEQGTRFRVPRAVTVGGQEYQMLPYGSPDSGRRVAHLFDFVKRYGDA